MLLIAVLLKVWSTVKICGTRVPQNAIVPVGRPRPYSTIILNMRLIPKALLACKQTDCITAGMWKLPDPKRVLTPSKHKTFV